MKDIHVRSRLGLAFFILIPCACHAPSTKKIHPERPSVSLTTMVVRAEPFSESFHGIKLSDEYRWMEDPTNDGEMRAWVQAESRDARAVLSAIPEREQFAQAMRNVSSALTTVSSVQSAGQVRVFLRKRAQDQVARLIVQENDKERVFIDPNVVAGESVAAINNFALSPDAKFIAIHQASGGREIGDITIYELATGKTIGSPISHIWGEFPLVWLNSRSFAYTQMRASNEAGDPLQNMKVYIGELGRGITPVPVLGFGVESGSDLANEEFPSINASIDSNWILGVASGARADRRYLLSRREDLLDGKPRWTVLATLEDRVQQVEVHADAVFMLTDKNNSAGELWRRSLTTQGLGTAERVFAGTDRLILTGIAVANDGVYLKAQSDGMGRVFYSARHGEPFVEIALPFEGGEMSTFERRVDGQGIAMAYSSWFQNLRHFTVFQGKVQVIDLASDTWEGAKNFVAERTEARSNDGTMIPMVVLRRAGVLPNNGVPTILEAYGGYGVTRTTPVYRRDWMVWLSQGGAAAICGVRGGGERGRAWHEGGRGPNKSRGHEDFQACAQELKTKKIATARGPVGFGLSMGGVLVQPAVIKKPDLFAGMVASVAILNATRIANAPNGPNQFDEMGDPRDPNQYPSLLAMDAYQLLKEAKAIPPTLVTIGLNDQRVAPWMSAKFSARAKARFGTDRILLRVEGDSGHGIGSAEDVRVAEIADICAFAWNAASTSDSLNGPSVNE